jgi:hypothetical protein
MDGGRQGIGLAGGGLKFGGPASLPVSEIGSVFEVNFRCANTINSEVKFCGRKQKSIKPIRERDSAIRAASFGQIHSFQHRFESRLGAHVVKFRSD